MIKHRYLQLKAKINYGLLSIFPWHYCNLCQTRSQHIICNNCLNTLPQINDNCCQICKKTTLQKLCIECSSHLPYFNNIFALFRYSDPLRHVLHQYKYHNKRHYHIMLSYLLQFHDINIDNYDIIIPMPSHRNKINQRGFDHIELLLSYWLLNPRYSNKIRLNTIKKLIDTKPQVSKKLHSRTETIENIYRTRYDFDSLRVLVIDDVVTTGSTINILAQFLKQNGATIVDCICLMRTVYD